MSCGVGQRHSLDLALLWLWCRLAAKALIQPLAWEPPHAVGTDLKKKKRQRQEKKISISSGSGRCRGGCLIPTPAEWVKDPATAVAWVVTAVHIQSLVWELPYAASTAIKLKKKF